MNTRNLLPVACLMWLSSTAIGHAAPLVFTHEVDARHNLFHDDWGHGYQQSFAELFAQPEWWSLDPEAYALGGGLAAVAVSDAGGGAVDFSTYGPSVIEASTTGWVLDNGPWWTAPDGDDWLFRGLRAYSLIGIWSSDPNSIQPLAGYDAFFLGSFAVLDVPLAATGVYLFLANNDGWFHDNAGSYQVELVLRAVPEPATLGLFALALLALGRMRRA